jgi:tRNA A-37 threonylcarbamoyl transferase component Bud32
MFHSQIQKHDDRTRTIHWARIVCLNQLDSNAALTYIRRNWLKFFWDIFRGIFGFYVCGFHHGDVSLDNIGIRDGSFVLYDYNLSRANRYASDDLYRDIYTLFRSLHWRIAREVLCHKEKCLIDTLQYIHTLEEYIEYVREEQNFRTNSEALLFLDALTIQPYTQANQRDSDDNYPEP